MAIAASTSSTEDSPSRREFAVLGLVTLTLILTAFYVAPATVFLFNASEVTIPVTEVIKTSWGAQAGLMAAVAILGLFVRSRGRRILTAMLLALAALLYLQGNVFVWEYGRFDGSEIDWTRHRIAGVFEVIVWLGVLATAVVFSKRLWRFLPRIALIITLLNVASLAGHLLSGRTFVHATASGIDDQLYQFSKEQNTLIVIMDAFASPAFDLMLTEDPTWRERLDGFTYYQDALGVYPTTLPSIPAILTGNTYDNSQPVGDFLRANLPDKSLPSVLQEQGFLTHTITKPIYGRHLEDVPFAVDKSFLDTQPQNRRLRDALRIWNVALFRYSPHVLKMQVYADHRWLLQGRNTSAAPGSAPVLPFSAEDNYRVPSPGQKATWILRRQLLDNMAVDSGRPTFKFLHFVSTHTPHFLDNQCVQITKKEFAERGHARAVIEQSTCAMNEVLEILDRLRDLGVLDKTLVILTGDHGSHINLIDKSDAAVDWNRIPGISKVLPLLLVKPSGAEGPLQVSRAPVSLIDIPNTVVADMNINRVFPGRALQKAQEDEPRTRVYFDYTWENSYWREDYLPPMQEYKVNGPARDPASWSQGRLLSSARNH